MNITLMAHDKKKELMVQFCTAYKSILSKHSLVGNGGERAPGIRGDRPARHALPVQASGRASADRCAHRV